MYGHTHAAIVVPGVRGIPAAVPESDLGHRSPMRRRTLRLRTEAWDDHRFSGEVCMEEHCQKCSTGLVLKLQVINPSHSVACEMSL